MNKILTTLRIMDWSRKLFLGVGILLAISGAVSGDAFLAIIGIYSSAKSWFNWGCASGSCSLPENKIKSDA